MLEYTPVSIIPESVHALRSTFLAGTTKPLVYRKSQLKALLRLVEEHSDDVAAALYRDLHKSKAEALCTEVYPVIHELRLHLTNLDAWSSPESLSTGLLNKMNSCVIRKEPKGCVLIIGAWNYPFLLLISPLIGAISAGNTAIIKPSEVSEHTAELIQRLMPLYLDSNSFVVVNGAVPETTALLEQPFDHIFYTGSGMVGKIVMTAAAKHLTPVTLELGGKSPAFIDENIDIGVVAKRLVWGKLMNCGQTCIAPDYLLCHASVVDPLVAEIRRVIQEIYGQEVQKSEWYGRIVNRNHWKRLNGLLERTKGKTVIGGERDEEGLFIAPTVVSEVTWEDSLMETELFGPILPIISTNDFIQATREVNKRDQPLALYVFSRDKQFVENILNRTRSGGVVINDSLLHFAESALPFGGVGPSGLGAYHGKASFDVFSHQRSTLITSQGLEWINDVRYPPYTPKKLSMMKSLLSGEAEKRLNKGKNLGLMALVGIVVGVFLWKRQ